MSIDVPIAQVNFIVKSLFHAMPSTAARVLYLGLMLSFPKCYGSDVQLGGNSCAFKKLDILSASGVAFVDEFLSFMHFL